MKWQQTALARYLRNKNSEYYGKVEELREAVEGWLGYVVAMFPHYTSHTVKHSDEIILQLSKLLFRDEDNPRTAVVQFTATEAYILMASAYLHDIGMVVSPKDQREILASAGWEKWIASDSRASGKWKEIQSLRAGTRIGDVALRHLVADIQTRYLIAEHVRRGHHLRAATIMSEHENLLGRFAFGDPQLLRAIAEVCVAHGLGHRDLDDHRRFPYRADIRGDKVSIKFLAILLRLGDLLDMSIDRAIPLLFRASTPLPSDSVAHWTQYQRIVTRTTAFDKISIQAQCENQEEHRFLQDWCEWLIDELKNAEAVMARSERHASWRPPSAQIEGPGATISIERAPTATYKPVKWKIVVDHDAILQRVISDVYSEDNVFVRELIQNAADANRCQLYNDLRVSGSPLPQYPTEVPEAQRDSYPIKVSLEVRQQTREVTGDVESRQVLIIDDCGIGMDVHVIQNYFLQIGRSYYTSDEFKRQFAFTPTSRFGIGFLSVFGASDRVIVETFKPSSNEGPLRLTLNGPKSYLLVEEGRRTSPGTRIEVWLSEDWKQGTLTSLILQWCRRLEFPTYVDDLGKESVIRRETPGIFALEFSGEKDTRHVAHPIPVSAPGIEGEVYVFGRVDAKGIERWDVSQTDVYHEFRSLAAQGHFPNDLACLHGIAVEEKGRFGLSEWSFSLNPSARLDFRAPTHNPTLSRSSGKGQLISWFRLEALAERVIDVLKAHIETCPLAQGTDGWRYKQRLVSHFPFESFWANIPNMIRIYRHNTPEMLSLNDLLVEPCITVLLHVPYQVMPRAKRPNLEGRTVLWANDFASLSRDHRVSLIGDRQGVNVREVDKNVLAVDFVPRSGKNGFIVYSDLRPAELPKDLLGVSAYPLSLLNSSHAVTQWLNRVLNYPTDEYRDEWPGRTSIINLIERAARGSVDTKDLGKAIDNWRHLPDLPPSLLPPPVELSHLAIAYQTEDSELLPIQSVTSST